MSKFVLYLTLRLGTVGLVIESQNIQFARNSLVDASKRVKWFTVRTSRYLAS